MQPKCCFETASIKCINQTNGPKKKKKISYLAAIPFIVKLCTNTSIPVVCSCLEQSLEMLFCKCGSQYLKLMTDLLQCNL